MKKELPPHMAGSSPETVLEIFEDGQKVFLEVFYIFKTYGKAQKRIRNSLFFCFFRRQVRVSLGAGIGHEAFGTAQTFSKLDEGNPFKDFLGLDRGPFAHRAGSLGKQPAFLHFFRAGAYAGGGCGGCAA